MPHPAATNAVKTFYIILSFAIVGFYAMLTLVGAKHSFHEQNMVWRLNDLKHTTIARVEGEGYQECLTRARTIVDERFQSLTFIPSTMFTDDIQEWQEKACGALFAPHPQTVRKKTLSARLIYIKDHLDEFLMRLGIRVTDAIASALRETANLARVKRHNALKNVMKENTTSISSQTLPPTADRMKQAFQQLADKLAAKFSNKRVNAAILNLFNLFADSIMNAFAILSIILAVAVLYLIRLDLSSTNGSPRNYVPYVNGYTPRQFLKHGRDIPIAIFAYFSVYASFCVQILAIYLLHDGTSPGANDILMVYGLGGICIVLWFMVLVAREPNATVFEKLDSVFDAVGTHLSRWFRPMTALFNVTFVQRWVELKNYFAEWLQYRLEENVLSDSMIVHPDEVDETDFSDNTEDSTQQVEDPVEKDEEVEANHGINADADSTTLHIQGNQQSDEQQKDDAVMDSVPLDSGSETDSSDDSWISVNESELVD